MGHLKTLDALRGVAALAVVVYHMHAVGLAGQTAQHGYLAVDFFFELSGVVLALAYRRKRAEGMTFGDFTLRRLVRIYPLAFVGVFLGTLILILQWIKQPVGSLPINEIILSGTFNTFILPNPFSTDASFNSLFPSNGPVWSLFFELAINLAWGAFLWRLSKSIVAVLCSLSAFWLVSQVLAHGDADMGVSWMTFSGGLARVCFGFLFGTLVEICGWRLPATRNPFFTYALVAFLIAALFLPTPPSASGVYDLICIFVLFPIMLFIGMAQDGGGAIGRFFGDVSYPLYAIHYPLLVIARLPYRSTVDQVPRWFFCSLTLIASIAISYVMLLIYDKPVRRGLNRALRSLGHGEAVSSVRDGIASSTITIKR